MCWSFEASMLTGSGSWIVGFYLLRRNVRWDRASALFLMAVSSMQFADAALWWDGMGKGLDGSCSTTNWIVSAIFIPLILRLQLSMRQMELRFKAFPASAAALLAFIAAGYAVAPEAWGPSLAWHYFRDRACSTASGLEVGSPLWGGINMPIFCFVIYFCFSLPPMFQSDRIPEALLYVCTLLAALTFKEAWSSKFCSFACIMSVWYLFYSGPALPPHALEHKTRKDNGNSFITASNAYESFLYGTARAK